MKTIYPSFSKKAEVIIELDKAGNDIVFVCEAHYMNYISK